MTGQFTTVSEDKMLLHFLCWTVAIAYDGKFGDHRQYLYIQENDQTEPFDQVLNFRVFAVE